MAEKKSGWDAWNKKQMKKALKKVHTGYLIVIAVFLIIGAIVGGGYAYVCTANDCFILQGNKETTVSVGDALT